MESFGNLVRRLRESRQLLLREVASELGIDPSLLSRIECGKKRATKEQVLQLASALSADQNELMIFYISDNLVYELYGEELALDAIQAAEKKIRYLSQQKQLSLKLKAKKSA
jgi:transcriptional regulator with XRE-family HTH domain